MTSRTSVIKREHHSHRSSQAPTLQLITGSSTMNLISTNVSIIEAFIHLATTFLPNSDEILRKASLLIIQIIGIKPHIEQNENILRKCKSKEKIVEARQFLKLQRMVVENKLNQTRRRGEGILLNSTSYMRFLLHHRKKHLSYKAKYCQRPVNSVLLTIEESDEI